MNHYRQGVVREVDLNHYQQGIEQLALMLGPERAQAIAERFRALNPAFEQEVIAVVFGRTWSRRALDRKSRSLCSIGILSALGRTSALRIVFELAIRNGATLDELTETLLQVAIYGGYPAALDALMVLESVLEGLDTASAGEAKTDARHERAQFRTAGVVEQGLRERRVSPNPSVA
ncbi:MAG: carboxymuconolactone decarboxylase family protein [Betaproteobacteria bacterium]|nr:carboxymuconolactone decarboxylase family protein [Betaproteobacteria bacterium]